MDLTKRYHQDRNDAMRVILDELAPNVPGYGPDKQRASGIGFDELSRRAGRRADEWAEERAKA